MVLPRTAMHTGEDKPKLRAVMLQNVAGLHYIYLTTEKPPADSDSLSVPTLRDSDRSEHPKDRDLSEHLPQASSSPTPKYELYNGEEAVERDCNQTQSIPPVKITKTISTSTDDIVYTILTEDKSTSTDDLETFEDKTESVESSDTENNDKSVESEFHSTSLNDESDNICAGPEYQDTNLTDATKVQFLQSQLFAIQTQSVQERRKFSETRRYWTDPMIANNLGLNELQRASSSPSLLGE